MKNKNAQAIHDKSMELLQTVGTRFLHPEAIEILKKHGVKVDGN
ncbi:trimethylamine methyltransferase family protein, partial [Muricomes intestini]